jgi:hypothetical protein
MWDLWWTKWHWGRFLARVLRLSPVSIVPLVLHTRPLLSHRRSISKAVDRVFEYTRTCISPSQFVYRGHIRGKFNRWCQVLWVLCFLQFRQPQFVLPCVSVAIFVCTWKYLVTSEVHICCGQIRTDIPVFHKALTWQLSASWQRNRAAGEELMCRTFRKTPTSVGAVTNMWFRMYSVVHKCW